MYLHSTVLSIRIRETQAHAHVCLYMVYIKDNSWSLFVNHFFATPPIGFVHLRQSRTPSADWGLMVLFCWRLNILDLHTQFLHELRTQKDLLHSPTVCFVFFASSNDNKQSLMAAPQAKGQRRKLILFAWTKIVRPKPTGADTRQ